MLNALHGVRALASIAVAAIHLYGIDRLSTDGVLPKFMEYTRLGTDIFFVVSGAVFAFSTQHMPRGAQSSGKILYDRFSRIFPTYWVVTLFVLSVWLISGHAAFSAIVVHPSLLSTAFLVPDGMHPALPVAWSLMQLAIYYIIFAAILMAPARLEACLLGLWAGLILLFTPLSNSITHARFQDIIAHPAALEFIAGIVTARVLTPGSKIPPAAPAAFAILWFLGAICFLGPSPNEPDFDNQAFRTILFGPCAISIVASAIAFDQRNNWTPPPLVRTLGDASYSLYLVHILAFSLVAHMWRSVERKGPWDNAIAIIFMAAAAFLAAYALHRWVELPAKRLTKKIPVWLKAQFNLGYARFGKPALSRERK